MEKYLAPEPFGKGELSAIWRRFKREFTLFLTAIGKQGRTQDFGEGGGGGGGGGGGVHINN